MILIKSFLQIIKFAQCLFITRYFICTWIVHQSCSVVQSLVGNYHLVVSYPQQCHIGINVSRWCVIIIAIHITLPYALQRYLSFALVIVICNEKVLTLQAKLFENVMIFSLKTLPFFFQMQEKLEACRNPNLTYFRRPFFWDDINITFTL